MKKNIYNIKRLKWWLVNLRKKCKRASRNGVTVEIEDLSIRFHSLWLRPCSLCKYSFGTLIWFWDLIVSTKASWDTFSPLLRQQELLHWNYCFFQPSAHSFGIEAALQKLAEKPLAWLLWDQAVSLGLAGISLQAFELQAVWIELFELRAL